MAVTVLYFAVLRELAETHQEQLSVAPGTTVARMLEQLRSLHQALRFEGVRCAVNEEFVPDSHVLADGDVLALIPPVSGG